MSLDISQTFENKYHFAKSDFPREHIQYSPAHGFTDASDSSLAEPATESFVNRWRYSSESGELTYIQTEIRPGFEVSVTKALFNKEMACSAWGHPSFLYFGACLSGHSTTHYCTVNEDVVIKNGDHGIFYNTRYSNVSQIQAGIPLLQVVVCLETEQLWHIFNNERQLLPAFVRHIMDRKPDRDLSLMGSATQTMRMAVRQIINCRQRGLARKLFLESKALELLSYQMEYFSTAESGVEWPQAMHPEDRRQTEYAHALLLSNIEQPPSLRELAKAVGMSHPKLSRCFKQMFGSTVFEYLRNERLLRARDMLENQGVTATEAAYAVGFNSISHFSKAYKKHFGKSPRINLE